MKVIHNINPIYNEYSKILILGSMPSKVSRENKFFYAHKTNRFWTVMSKLFNVSLNTNEEKTTFLLNHHIAMWDTIASCDISASSDASIKNVKVNDINKIIKNSNIKAIFCTGKKSYQIYTKYFSNELPVYSLPSPSSANANFSVDDLCREYEIIKIYLNY